MAKGGEMLLTCDPHKTYSNSSHFPSKDKADTQDTTSCLVTPVQSSNTAGSQFTQTGCFGGFVGANTINHVFVMEISSLLNKL